MKNIIITIGILIFCHTSIVISNAQDVNAVYQLVWSDEFSEHGPPDPDNWIFEEGFVRNEEEQWYQEENASCKDGYLVIEAREVDMPNPIYREGSTNWRTSREKIWYTSSCLKTQTKHQWKFGKIEVRAKIDARPGLWPAIWTLGVEGEWPSNGECDIMEYYRGMILANFAWGTDQRFKAKWDDKKIPIEKFGEEWSDDFHIWTLEWNKNSMKIFIDNELVNEVDLSHTINESDGKNPFHQPHYILLNFAIGGMNGGDPSETEFPSRYLVDYVRVYQEK